MVLPTPCDFRNDFILGDLIYGTTFDRGDYIDAATDKVDNDGAKVTIDRLTRQLDGTLRGFGSYATRQVTATEIDDLPQSAQLFLTYAKKFTTLWAKMQGQGVSNFTKNGVAKAMPGLGNQKKWSDPYMRAKCKAGIGFVLDSGFTVRFVLDSLWSAQSMETIARKESHQPWHTGSELRWVYRHRTHEKVAARVIFYRQGARVAAPWTAFSQSWAQYGNTRLDDTHVPEDFRKD